VQVMFPCGSGTISIFRPPIFLLRDFRPMCERSQRNRARRFWERFFMGILFSGLSIEGV